MHTARVGTTSFGFRYLLQDAQRAPGLPDLVRRAADYGLQALQICENARPLDVSPAEWRAVIQRGADLGVDIQVGCLTLNPDVLWRYADLAAMIPNNTVRIVLEEHGQGRPGRDDIARFMEEVAARLERNSIRLAIENHFDIPCRVLVEFARMYPPEIVGFCLDTANSLRNFESADQVFALLEGRAVCFHVKDYRVDGSNVGFSVIGAPLGCGDLGLQPVVDRILARHAAPDIFIENWVPASGDWSADVAADERWLKQSLANLNSALRVSSNAIA